ncbi:MAG: tRNA dihydrouridine(20/20a) synthase DusA [Lautropia sp.]|nr:tRNA dihydrouridine(20/20a) synthase DusA [Lautropia sp.]
MPSTDTPMLSATPAAPAGLTRVSVAPMMDWTDRHCRSFHRLLSSEAWLYTEMVTAQAIAHGDLDRLLGRGEEGGRVVLQLGGNDPALLASAAKAGVAYGYDEINLNCGCPSDRVQEGAFGACLMADPARVADCVTAMREAVDVPVTVKHRIGIDRREDYDFVHAFVSKVADAGCRRFIVHARNAWLDGLDPKQNREIPPLRYEVVHRLQQDFPGFAFELNGGLADLAAGAEAAQGRDGQPALDGVMFGRRAYHEPWLLAGVDRWLKGEAAGPIPSRRRIVGHLVAYLERQSAHGVELRHLARHVLGLYHGQPAARLWRRQLSDSRVLARNDPGVLLAVCEEVEAEAERVRACAEVYRQTALSDEAGEQR